MTKILPLFLLLSIFGCDPSPEEISRHNQKVAALEKANEELRMNLPSERPAVLKELDNAKSAITRLEKELADAKAATVKANALVEKANTQVPPEMLPLAEMLKMLQERVTVLESTASRKGHTHPYVDWHPLNTFNSSDRTTGVDR